MWIDLYIYFFLYYLAYLNSNWHYLEYSIFHFVILKQIFFYQNKYFEIAITLAFHMYNFFKNIMIDVNYT